MMSVPCISHLTASDMKPQLMAEIRREQAGGTTQFLFKKTWQNDILDFFVDVQRKKNQSLLKLIDTQVNCSAGQIKRHAPDCSEEDFST